MTEIPADIMKTAESLWGASTLAIARALVAERECCAYIARNGCLVPPDGGSPTESEAEMCDQIATRILNRA